MTSMLPAIMGFGPAAGSGAVNLLLYHACIMVSNYVTRHAVVVKSKKAS